MEEYALCADLEPSADLFKLRGWARRIGRIGQYGRSNIAEYRGQIRAMHNRGVEEPTAKMGPAAMLRRLYPNLHSLPGENEIRAEISKLVMSAKKKAQNATAPTGRHRVANVYGDFLETYFRSNPLCMPKDGLATIKLRFVHEDKYPHDFPTDTTIINKCNTTKKMLKNASNVINV